MSVLLPVSSRKHNLLWNSHISKHRPHFMFVNNIWDEVFQSISDAYSRHVRAQVDYLRLRIPGEFYTHLFSLPFKHVWSGCWTQPDPVDSLHVSYCVSAHIWINLICRWTQTPDCDDDKDKCWNLIAITRPARRPTHKQEAYQAAAMVFSVFDGREYLWSQMFWYLELFTSRDWSSLSLSLLPRGLKSAAVKFLTLSSVTGGLCEAVFDQRSYECGRIWSCAHGNETLLSNQTLVM